MTQAEISILKGWMGAGRLWVVPDKFDDDVCWMAATIGQDTAEQVGGRRRWLKAISNDAMRNHWCGLLSLPLFRRWKRAHMVQYTIESSTGAIELYEHSHSRVIHHPQSSGGLAAAATGSWHFPQEGSEAGWLCWGGRR